MFSLSKRFHTPHRFFIFLLMITFIHLADSIMGYLVPLVMERAFENLAIVGLVLSFSSIVGISSDILIARYFPQKKLTFFARLLLIGLFLFPLILLLPSHLGVFLIAMGIWGLYYEALIFTKYHGIHQMIQPHHHGWAWGVTESLHNLTMVIGPFIASYFLDIEQRLVLWIVLALCTVATILYGVLHFFKPPKTVPFDVEEHDWEKISFRKQLKVWRKYEQVLWPLLGLMILVYLVDSSFFSVGPIFAESMKLVHPLGGMFVSVYSMPGLVCGLLLGYLAKPFGKKRLAFGAGMFAGLGLMVMSTRTTVPAVIVTTFIASLGLGTMMPTLAAIFEDYVARAEEKGNFLISLMSMCVGIAYVIGPIINGTLAEKVGPQAVFLLWGIVLVWYSFILFFIVKRKIHLPQQAVEAVLTAKK